MENMLGLSQLNNHIRIFIFALLVSPYCLSSTDYSTQSSSLTWSIEKDRSTSEKHGLYEIQQEAKKYIDLENIKNHANIKVLEPDLRVQVPLCAIPLKTSWVPKDRGLSAKSVWVICDKTVDKKYPKWKVIVPVDDQTKVHKSK